MGKSEKERRERISASQRKFWTSVIEEQDPSAEPTEKRCSLCRELKPLSEFSLAKKKLKTGFIALRPYSQCKKCKLERNRGYKERLRAQGVLKEREDAYEKIRDPKHRRKRQREWNTARRREEGRPVKTRPTAGLGPKLPLDPIAKFVQERINKTGRTQFLLESQMDERRIRDILEGAYGSVSLKVVDRILTNLQCTELLSDLYPLVETAQPTRYEYIRP